MARKIDLKSVLFHLGYRVDEEGNVEETGNQLCLISMENTAEGGVLRLHSDANSFFYKGEDLEEVAEQLSFLSKVTSKYVYFEGAEEVKVSKKEFERYLFSALNEYYRSGKQQIAG